jgi:hypothetical protein
MSISNKPPLCQSISLVATCSYAKDRLSTVIKEDLEELEKLQKRHLYSHLFHRVKSFRLLKSGECTNLGEAAKALGYSWRQCQSSRVEEASVIVLRMAQDQWPRV